MTLIISVISEVNSTHDQQNNVTQRFKTAYTIMLAVKSVTRINHRSLVYAVPFAIMD